MIRPIPVTNRRVLRYTCDGPDVDMSTLRGGTGAFEAHGGAVYRFAAVLVRHHQDAEDVVQETFLKLLRHLEAGGDTTNLRGWLFTVAAHAARDRQRAARALGPLAAGARSRRSRRRCFPMKTAV